MANWLASMQQSFEYYIVDPGTWQDVKQITDVRSCTISRDSEVETLGSASIDTTEALSECYVRIYLVTIQNGLTEKHPLGTYLVQSPSTSFDGRVQSVSMDAYTPLIELKENPPPIGYSIVGEEYDPSQATNVMDIAYRLTRENMRGPVIPTTSSKTLYYNFVADTSDTWLSFLRALLSENKFTYALDEMGRTSFAPVQDIASLQPVWTYDDGNSSILYPELSYNRDIFGMPNVVEVIYSNGFYNDETKQTEYYLRIVNDDPNSPVSTVNRGRDLLHRVVNPNITGDTSVGVTKRVVQNYAESLLRSLSSVECVVSYTHAYCPVRLDDCVRLNYTRAGLTGVKAKVISQSIKCEPGCPVSERAVFTTKLWG